jgi:hypothetical protein
VAVGAQGTLLDYTLGSGWKVVTHGTGSATYWAVHGRSPTDVWIASNDGVALHYDGATTPVTFLPCNQQACSSALVTVWTEPQLVGPCKPWVAGDNGQYLRMPEVATGKFAALPPIPNFAVQNLVAVWGSSADDVWAGDDQGDISHFDGTQYKTYTTPGGTTLHGIWGQATNDVWAVGGSGLIQRWTGPLTTATWSPQLVPASAKTSTLYSITGNAAGERWAVGSGGLILYYDGNLWQKMPSPVTDTLYGVTVFPTASKPIAVGANGVILRLVGVP